MWTRVVPAVFVLAWFLALIGGYSFGGWLHLLLLAALLIFLWKPMSGQTE